VHSLSLSLSLKVDVGVVFSYAVAVYPAPLYAAMEAGSKNSLDKVQELDQVAVRGRGGCCHCQAA
jgi:hypothetical protein